MDNRITYHRHVFAWVFPIVWASVILALSLLPLSGQSVFTVKHFDKISHFIEYAVLSLLMVRSFRHAGSLPFAKSSLFTLILGGGYGILMELAQRFVPGRDANLHDAAANIAGLAFGIILGKLFYYGRNKTVQRVIVRQG